MQVAGKLCSVCSEKIFTDREGTWCAGCENPICLNCTSPDLICPTCKKHWDDPVKHFYYTDTCYSCLTPVAESENCRVCGAYTRWKNKNEHAMDVEYLKAWSRRASPIGVILILSGLFVIIAPIAVCVALLSADQPVLFWWFGLSFLSVPLFLNGFARLTKARGLRRLFKERSNANMTADSTAFRRESP